MGKHNLYIIILVLLFSCCNKQKKAILPSEIANKKWYKMEKSGGEYKVADTDNYYAIVTGNDKIEVFPDNFSEPNVFKVTKVDVLLENNIKSYLIHLDPKEPTDRLCNYLSYKVSLINPDKGLYYWLYYYDNKEWSDNQYCTFYAVPEDNVTQTSFFENRIPDEYRFKEYYKADYIKPYYYVGGDFPIFVTNEKSVIYNGFEYNVDYVDCSADSIRFIMDYAKRSEFILKKDTTGIYWGQFAYNDYPKAFPKVSHYIIRSSLIGSGSLPDRKNKYNYDTEVSYVKLLPPIYNTLAIDIVRQHPNERSRCRLARQIYNIDSYIRYKYPFSEEILRKDIQLFQEDIKNDVVVVINDYDEYKLLYFNKKIGEKNVYIVLSEIILYVPDIEFINRLSVHNTESHFYVRYTINDLVKEYSWSKASNQEDVWQYESSENVETEIKKGTRLEDIDSLSFN